MRDRGLSTRGVRGSDREGDTGGERYQGTAGVVEAIEAGEIDVIVGGFPCQDISCAGGRQGIDGARSGLWAEMRRTIGMVRPGIVIVENVPNLLAGDRGRWFGRVLGDLAALGYDAEWHCIPASHVGAPHIRDRVWIVAYAQGKQMGGARQSRETVSRVCDTDDQRQSTGAVYDEVEGVPGDDADTARSRRGSRRSRRSVDGGSGSDQYALRDTDGAGLELRRKASRGSIITTWPNTARSGWWGVEPDVGRVANGVSNRVDRIRCLGNAVVPQVVEWIGRAILKR